MPQCEKHDYFFSHRGTCPYCSEEEEIEGERKKEQRYKLMQDQDSHWYVIKVEDVKLFSSLEEKGAYDCYEEFDNKFESCKVGGCYSLVSFTNPKVGLLYLEAQRKTWE